LLAAVHHRRRELLVQSRLEADRRFLEQCFGAPQRKIDAAERRAAVAGDEARGVQAGARIAPALLEEQAHQRLRAREVDDALIEEILVVEVDGAHYMSLGSHSASGGKMTISTTSTMVHRI
jgi:hypothetical protein